MDRTILYRELVRLAGASEQIQSVDVLPDAFTEEATSIGRELGRLIGSLRLMRPRYLALSGSRQMSAHEREDFDYTARRLLQRETRRVRALEHRLDEHRAAQTAQSATIKGRWFSDPDFVALQETLANHRQGILLSLNLQLQAASQTLGDMQKVRFARGEGRLRAADSELKFEPGPKFEAGPESAEPVSLPAKPELSFEGSKLADNRQAEASAVPSHTEALPESGETYEQSSMLLLQEEHDSLLEDLNAMLGSAQKAEQSLREVAELQSKLSQHLASQSAQLQSLTADASRTTSHVTAANKQLESAKKRSKRASRIIIMSSLATGVFLLLLNGR